jgi:hypothetical protein
MKNPTNKIRKWINKTIRLIKLIEKEKINAMVETKTPFV